VSWRTVGGVNLFDGSCDGAGTPDFAVIFTAPATAVYRFEATSTEDSVITIAAGACSGLEATQVACNDDITPNVNLDSRIDLDGNQQLEEGETVTVYTGEVRAPGGGSGTLRISVLSD
jgi:hypothetical protein